MKLLLLADDGTVLDTTDEISREEWDDLSPIGAHSLLAGLSAGVRP